MSENINVTPSQFSIFKGKSAMRMQLQRPLAIEDKYKTGCVFLQVAPLKQQNGDVRIFDWEDKKISVKLGVQDLSQILYGFATGQKIDLFHEFGGTTKTINFSPNVEKGGYFLSVEQKNNGESQKVTVAVSSQETMAIDVMLRQALPLIHNWV